ncbi:hypothetical protein J4573_12485 [Actinomadura barringtoniae]|uniref:Peroxidase n=1 Tax=Actinomadura barringtoniae TaxID=1427535 RepID=A0A939P8W1_9ACTN|nr:hypothetical protein [Actinomadura barringtoniae]MBO2447913.1 hypothetical protein [Actinomadura barringtoniae]
MGFLETPDDDADEQVGRLFDADREALGYVANYTRVFALRPAVYSAWQQLNAAVKEGMDARIYELVTLAAARRLRSSYCSLAHGKVLRDRFYDAGAVEAIATDPHNAGLDPADMAIMDFAERVAADATAITEADIDELRRHGLTDADIFQVVLATSARCFFSTVLDAVGTEPDAQFRTAIEPELQQALTVGRDIAAADDQP